MTARTSTTTIPTVLLDVSDHERSGRDNLLDDLIAMPEDIDQLLQRPLTRALIRGGQ